jgi:hydrogenase large subunit
VDGQLAPELAAVQTKVKGTRRKRTAWHLLAWLLGPSRHEAQSGAEPDHFSHYLQALEFQRKSCQVVAILGGKTPHIQNLAVGGVMNAINLNSLATMNMDRLGHVAGDPRRSDTFCAAGLSRR